MSAKDDLSPKQAAEQLGLNPATVRRYVADGTIPAYKIGPKLIRIKAADVAAMIHPNTAAQK